MENSQLDLHQQVLVKSIKVYISGPMLQTRQCITIPSRSLMVLNAKATIDKHMEGGLHKVVPNFLLSDEYPELVLIPTVHNCNVNDYLSFMKTSCIRLYRRTVETETMMNSFVYIYLNNA